MPYDMNNRSNTGVIGNVSQMIWMLLIIERDSAVDGKVQRVLHLVVSFYGMCYFRVHTTCNSTSTPT